MATDRNDVIIDIKVEYSDAVVGIAKFTKSTEELKKANAELKKSLNENTITQDEYTKSVAANKVDIDLNKASVRALEKEIKNEIKVRQEQEGSLSSLRAQLSNATKEYDNMSKAERNGAKGAELRDKINGIADSLKSAEEETQRFYRNVGNYDESISKAISSSGGFAGMLADLGKQAQSAGGFLTAFTGKVKSVTAAIIANPIIAILAAAIAIFTAFKKVVNSSEEATARWNAILAPLGKALQIVLNVLQAVVGWVLKGVESFLGLAMSISRLLEKLPFVGKYLAEVNNEIEKSTKLEQAKYDLEKLTRETLVENAKNERDIAKLRTEANDKANFSAEERLKKIQQANALEKENADRNLAIAQEKLRIAEVEASYSENKKETEAELAQLRADVYKAETDHYNKIRELGEKENTFRAEITANEKQRDDERIAAAKEYQANLKEQKDKEQDAIRQAEDAILAIAKDGAEKQRQAINTSYDRQIEDLRTKLAEDKNLTVKAKEAINSTIASLEEKRRSDLAKISDEEIAKQIDTEQKRIELKLASIKKGSDEELTLRLQQLELERQQEISEAEKIGLAVADVNAKYDKVIADAKAQAAETSRKKAADEMTLEWENKIAEAQLNGQETLTLELERRKTELDSLHQMEGETDAEFKARQLEAQQNYADAEEAVVQKEIEIEQTKLQAMSDITGAIGGLFDTLGEDSKAFAIAGKAMALAQIAVDTGKAISAGVASAMATPFPGNIAAVATTVATVIGNISSAIKTVKSAKFADGGLVAGPGSGTSDSIPAQLSNGESVMTARTTSMFSPLLSALNQMGGGIPISTAQTASNIMGEDMLAHAVARGVSTLPRPIVSVQEISNIESRVSVYETISQQ